MNVKEIWTPKPMTASGDVVGHNCHIGGFLCTSSSSGTLKITAGLNGDTIVDTAPVTAGAWYPLPFYCQHGAYAVLTDCAGTFAV